MNKSFFQLLVLCVFDCIQDGQFIDGKYDGQIHEITHWDIYNEDPNNDHLTDEFISVYNNGATPEKGKSRQTFKSSPNQEFSEVTNTDSGKIRHLAIYK